LEVDGVTVPLVWRGAYVAALIGDNEPSASLAGRGLEVVSFDSDPASWDEAFEGQPPIGGPTPVRDPRAADRHRIGIQVVAGSRGRAERAAFPQPAEFPI
jgi:hypothetical protein